MENFYQRNKRRFIESITGKKERFDQEKIKNSISNAFSKSQSAEGPSDKEQLNRAQQERQRLLTSQQLASQQMLDARRAVDRQREQQRRVLDAQRAKTQSLRETTDQGKKLQTQQQLTQKQQEQVRTQQAQWQQEQVQKQQVQRQQEQVQKQQVQRQQEQVQKQQVQRQQEQIQQRRERGRVSEKQVRMDSSKKAPDFKSRHRELTRIKDQQFAQKIPRAGDPVRDPLERDALVRERGYREQAMNSDTFKSMVNRSIKQSERMKELERTPGKSLAEARELEHGKKLGSKMDRYIDLKSYQDFKKDLKNEKKNERPSASAKSNQARTDQWRRSKDGKLEYSMDDTRYRKLNDRGQMDYYRRNNSGDFEFDHVSTSSVRAEQYKSAQKALDALKSREQADKSRARNRSEREDAQKAQAKLEKHRDKINNQKQAKPGERERLPGQESGAQKAKGSVRQDEKRSRDSQINGPQENAFHAQRNQQKENIQKGLPHGSKPVNLNEKEAIERSRQMFTKDAQSQSSSQQYGHQNPDRDKRSQHNQQSQFQSERATTAVPAPKREQPKTRPSAEANRSPDKQDMRKEDSSMKTKAESEKPKRQETWRENQNQQMTKSAPTHNFGSSAGGGDEDNPRKRRQR